jgi:hypothetical protein
MKPHKWHKEIKAWADGAEIEYKFYKDQIWDLIDPDGYPPFSDSDYVFRIKLQPKEPQYLYVYNKGSLDHPEYVLYSEVPEFEIARCLFLIGKIKLENE